MQCGHKVRTKSDLPVNFIAILPEDIPARLLVEVDGRMENYYLDGTYLGATNPSDDDLKMAGFFD